MNVRRVVGLGILIGGVVLGLSCSGPDDASTSSPDDPGRLYHVQLGMTEDKGAANDLLGDALAWWEDQSKQMAATPLSRGDSSRRPVQVHWKAPLYRVRLGPFPTRSTAEAVVTAAQSSFPGAFVAPERPSSQSNTP